MTTLLTDEQADNGRVCTALPFGARTKIGKSRAFPGAAIEPLFLVRRLSRCFFQEKPDGFLNRYSPDGG
jgi:hypothetical protein